MPAHTPMTIKYTKKLLNAIQNDVNDSDVNTLSLISENIRFQLNEK